MSEPVAYIVVAAESDDEAMHRLRCTMDHGIAGAPDDAFTASTPVMADEVALELQSEGATMVRVYGVVPLKLHKVWS